MSLYANFVTQVQLRSTEVDQKVKIIKMMKIEKKSMKTIHGLMREHISAMKELITKEMDIVNTL